MLIALLFLLQTSGFPAWSAVLFILGAGIWVLSFLLGRLRRPDVPAEAWTGFGVDVGTLLMIAGIGLKTIFGA